jgi:hypothetical protein
MTDPLERGVTKRNYQVLIQDQDAVLAWVSQRLGVAGKQAEDKDCVLVKSWVIGLEFLAA